MFLLAVKLLEDLTSGCWARSTLSAIDARCAAWLPLPQRSKCIVIIEATCLMMQLLHVFLVVAAGILDIDGVQDQTSMLRCVVRGILPLYWSNIGLFLGI